MTLIDLVEMICDWLAATRRHDDGDIRRSIEVNQERFGYGDQLKRILHNTVDALGNDAVGRVDARDRKVRMDFDSDGYLCCRGCTLGTPFKTRSTAAMIAHLEEHRKRVADAE